MKKRNLLQLIILFSILIFFFIKIYVSSEENIQLAPSGETNVKIQVGNAAPIITNIPPIQNIDLAPGSAKDITISFTARDANGASNLDDTSAKISFTNLGEQTRESTSCIKTNEIGKERTYSCIIPMMYYDKSGIWNAEIIIKDIVGATAQRTSQFTVNLLRDISLSPTTINFPTVVQGGINTMASENTLITNNGNAEVPSNSLEITSSNLIGETNPSETIPAANFRVASKSEADVCTNGNALISNSPVSILSVTLPRGPANTNTEELSYCIALIPEDISSQFYSTSGTGGQPWIITLN